MAEIQRLPSRPTFPKARLAFQTGSVAIAAIALVEYFGTPRHLPAKVELFFTVVAISAVVTITPFCLRFALYGWRVVKLMPTIENRIRAERDNTWWAVETNNLFGDRELNMLRMKLNGDDVLVYLNVGRLQGAKKGQQFEIVAVPDMERYGVISVTEVGEENCWCELHHGEGQPDFIGQMRARLTTGELQPPGGYEVRPFMAEAYRRVVRSLVDQSQSSAAQAAFTEGDS